MQSSRAVESHILHHAFTPCRVQFNPTSVHQDEGGRSRDSAPPRGGDVRGDSLPGLDVVLEAEVEVLLGEVSGEALPQGLPGPPVIRQPQIAADDMFQQAQAG